MIWYSACVCLCCIGRNFPSGNIQRTVRISQWRARTFTNPSVLCCVALHTRTDERARPALPMKNWYSPSGKGRRGGGENARGNSAKKKTQWGVTAAADCFTTNGTSGSICANRSTLATNLVEPGSNKESVPHALFSTQRSGVKCTQCVSKRTNKEGAGNSQRVIISKRAFEAHAKSYDSILFAFEKKKASIDDGLRNDKKCLSFLYLRFVSFLHSFESAYPHVRGA